MLKQATIDKLIEMRLTSMADAYRMQDDDPSMAELSFDERFGMLVDRQYDSRKSNTIKRLIKNAQFNEPDACVADINYTQGRKLSKEMIQELATCKYICDHHDITITGATGSGKTYLANALGIEACKHFYKTRYVRLPDMLMELKVARDNDNYTKVLERYTRPVLLILDEWLLLKPTHDDQTSILEILERRYGKVSTIYCSQYTQDGWYERLGGDDNTLTDAIMDRIVHNTYKIDIVPVDPSKDISMRQVYGLQ
ncbi:MAG: IS21-like element helper ATPase IstB [Prevotella sp.]